MAIIEGIGDEVLTFFITVAVIAVAVLAWISTNTAERPLLRTVLILERHQPRTASSPQPSTSSTAQEKPPETPSTSVSSEETSVQAAEEVSESIDGPRIIRLTETTARSISDQEESAGNGSEIAPENNLPEDQNEILRLMDDCESSPSHDRKGKPDEMSVEETSQREAEEAPTEEPTAQQASIRINLKFLNDDLRSVQGSLQEQVGDFKRRNFSTELSARSIVRLVFNGKLLGQDTQTLGNYGLHDNCVVHCLVHQQRTPPATPNATSTAGTASDAHMGIGHSLLSNMLLIILSGLLAVAWYGRYHYAQWFTATSTVALVGVTGLFTVFLIGIYIPENNQI